MCGGRGVRRGVCAEGYVCGVRGMEGECVEGGVYGGAGGVCGGVWCCDVCVCVQERAVTYISCSTG